MATATIVSCVVRRYITCVIKLPLITIKGIDRDLQMVNGK